METFAIHEMEADERTIVTGFLRAMVEEMVTVGGFPVADDDAWQQFEQNHVVASDDHKFWLASADENERVGMAEAAVINSFVVFKPQPILHIHAVYVTPEYRKQGIGRAFIETALDWGRRKNCEEALLTVLVNNPARALYEAVGFKPFEIAMRHTL